MKKASIGLILLVSTFLTIFLNGCYKNNKENKPTVITSSITDITTVSAIAGGSIVNDQGETVAARGVCWDTISGPTIMDNCTNVGGSMWEFTSPISGLAHNTKYYVRAYATLRQPGDEAGTGYGNEVTFTTLP
jgi:trimeric autotransporter adhesin